MKVVTAPHRITFRGKVNIFLAGSIEMGEATEWQKEAIGMFQSRIPSENQEHYQILNPRRPDWDYNWKQEYENPQFSPQVRWELNALNEADGVLFYFDPATKSPISLLELGRYYDKAVVVCPEGFWKKGNIDIFCEENDLSQFSGLEEAVTKIVNQIEKDEPWS